MPFGAKLARQAISRLKAMFNVVLIGLNCLENGQLNLSMADNNPGQALAGLSVFYPYQ
jgi:hypothetical protein